MRRILSLVLVALATAGSVLVAGPATAAPPAPFPVSISVPDGWSPEGVAVGRGTDVYVGSLAGGGIWAGDLRTGQGGVLVPGAPGTAKTGLKVDAFNRIWAAGASGGDATVYDAATGAALAHYQFTTDPNTFVNDLVVTPAAVYFTDSFRPFLYVVPLGPGGRLPAQASALPLTGPAAALGGFSNNGIVATQDGHLLVVQSSSGRLVNVDPATGASTTVDLGGYSVVNGDGLVLRGHTLWVVRNVDDIVAVIRLDDTFLRGTLDHEITSPLFRVPATAALFGSSLYLVNARFDVPSTPTTDYNVVHVPA